MNPNLLIIEDDNNLRQMLQLHFEDQGYSVTEAVDCSSGLQAAKTGEFDLVLLDQQLPDGLGVDLLSTLRRHSPDLPVIMMTGQHDLELAIDAIKIGAVDYLHKPVSAEALQVVVSKTLKHKTGAAAAKRPPSLGLPMRDLIGRSVAMLEVSKQIALSAQNRANVLVQGESGTGKEVVARLIHQHSGREGPFVAVNCAAIVDNLLESELFGHEKGAFTGADRSKPGRFEIAQHGTLFLDEIAELALPLQAKLLRALQQRVIERVGATAPIEVDVRIIAATHQDLFELAAEGAFREDLAYRLAVIPIGLPALRERIDDIPLLCEALLARIAKQNECQVPIIDSQAMVSLQRHSWPGNVRELENVLTQAMLMARDGLIRSEHLRLQKRTPTPPLDDPKPMQKLALRTLDEVEAEHIQRVLNYTAGHKGKTATILGISRPALDRKIQKYALKVG